MNLIKINFYIFLLASLWACKNNKTQEQVADNQPLNEVKITLEQFKSGGIQLVKLEKQNLNQVLQVNGMIDLPPQNLISVSAIMGGFVRQTDILQGMKIQKGQVLAIIENQDLLTMQQDYLESKSKWDYLNKEYLRQQELSKENISALKNFQQIQAEYSALQVKINVLAKKLSLVGINPQTLQAPNISASYVITAPQSGFITEVNTNLGKFVQPNETLFEIADNSHVHAELSVFEKDINKLSIGQKAWIKLANQNEEELSATIYLINRKINADRTVRVHAHFDKDDHNLFTNTYLKARIELGNQKLDALPTQAVVQFEGKNYIFYLKNQTKESYTFEMLEVKKGAENEAFIEVILPEKYQSMQFAGQGAFALLGQLKNVGEEE